MKTYQRCRELVSNKYKLLFLGLIIIHLLPIWIFSYFPSQDGPTHVNNANIIREYSNPEYNVYQKYYLLNKNPEPTWFGHIILAGLMCIFPVLIAEKIFLSAYIILLPISINYALLSIHPGVAFLSFLSFPFIYNYVFHMGFYSFSFSLAFFFFFVGYWMRNRQQFTFRNMFILALLSLILYFFHIVSLVMAYVALSILIFGQILFVISQHKHECRYNWSCLWDILKNNIFMPFIAIMPTLVLVVFFLFQRKTAAATASPFSVLLGDLYRIASLISYSKAEVQVATSIFFFFLAISMYHIVLKALHHKLIFEDTFFLIFSVFIVIYFVSPDTYLISSNGMLGGAFMKQRLNIFPFFALMLWFGVQHYPVPLKWLIMVFCVGITITLLSLHMVQYAKLNSYLKEYISAASHIEPNTTLLPISYSQKGKTPEGQLLSLKIRPFLHSAGYIAAQKNIVTLNNYEANTGYFPILFRPQLNPFVHIVTAGKMDDKPPWVDFISYHKKTGGYVDYVLIWGVRKEEINTKVKMSASIVYQLKKGYDLIYVSPKRELLQLYRRKNWR